MRLRVYKTHGACAKMKCMHTVILHNIGGPNLSRKITQFSANDTTKDGTATKLLTVLVYYTTQDLERILHG